MSRKQAANAKKFRSTSRGDQPNPYNIANVYLNKPNKMYKSKMTNRDMGSGGGGRIRSPGGEDARLNMSITNGSADHGVGFGVSGTGKHIPMQ